MSFVGALNNWRSVRDSSDEWRSRHLVEKVRASYATDADVLNLYSLELNLYSLELNLYSLPPCSFAMHPSAD